MWLMKKQMMWESVLPFITMVLLEGCTIALTITANVAMEYYGMNQFVFVAYSNALSALILVPYSFFFHRDGMRASLNLKLMIRFFFLGFTGISIAQNLAYSGLRDSSPIVVCAMGLLLPCFQFFLALFQGQTKVDLRRTSCKIKIVGIVVSFIGAAVVAAYQGPSIIPSSLFNPQLLLHGKMPLLVSLSTTRTWIFGCVLLACATFFLAIWGILQVSTYKKLPDMMVIVTWYTLFGTIQTAVVDLIAEQDLSAWKLSINLELAIIVLTAFFGTFGRSRLQAWCMNMKGSMYVAMFRPFGIFWACAITLSLFGNTLHYGSVVGATISGGGYYAMMWAATKEEEEKKKDESETVDSRSEEDQLKTPLLQNQEDQV